MADWSEASRQNISTFSRREASLRSAIFSENKVDNYLVTLPERVKLQQKLLTKFPTLKKENRKIICKKSGAKINWERTSGKDNEFGGRFSRRDAEQDTFNQEGLQQKQATGRKDAQEKLLG
jgi:hypothetical protein